MLSVCLSSLSVMLMYCGQRVGLIRMPLGTEANLVPGHIVLDRDPAASPKGAQPQFSAHICCGQTARWIKMPLGTEVGLGPGNIVLDGDAAPRRKEHRSLPLFGPWLLWPNGRPSRQLVSSLIVIIQYLLC